MDRLQKELARVEMYGLASNWTDSPVKAMRFDEKSEAAEYADKVWKGSSCTIELKPVTETVRGRMYWVLENLSGDYLTAYACSKLIGPSNA